MPQYNGTSHICTDDNIVEVGGEYQYSEDGYIANIVILKDNSGKEGHMFMEFKVRIQDILCWSRYGKGIGPKKGDEVDLGSSDHGGAYSGMWRIWKRDEYASVPVPNKG